MMLLDFQSFVRTLQPRDRKRFERLFKDVYTVAATGHGSPLVLENPPEELSWEEAEKIASRWPSIADTIGGTSAVIKFATGEVMAHY